MSFNFRLNKFYQSVINSIDEWSKWYDSDNPQETPIPEPFENIDGLEKLVIIKCIRFDKVVPAIQVCILFYLFMNFPTIM